MSLLDQLTSSGTPSGGGDASGDGGGGSGGLGIAGDTQNVTTSISKTTFGGVNLGADVFKFPAPARQEAKPLVDQTLVTSAVIAGVVVLLIRSLVK